MEPDRPVFVSTRVSGMFTGLVLATISLLMGVEFLQASREGVVGLISCAAFATYMLWGTLRNWVLPVRSAKLYQDKVILDGRAGKRELRYPEIQTASLTHSPKLFLPSSQIILKTEQYGNLVILGNTHNKKLRMDLFSWLSERVAQSRTPSSVDVDKEALPVSVQTQNATGLKKAFPLRFGLIAVLCTAVGYLSVTVSPQYQSFLYLLPLGTTLLIIGLVMLVVSLVVYFRGF